MFLENSNVISRALLMNLDLELMGMQPRKRNLCPNPQFLNAERTPIILFVLVQTFVFVVPFFASVLLLIDNVNILHEDYADKLDKSVPFGPIKEQAMLNIFVLVTICIMSFVEMFALRSIMFLPYVCTEAIIWVAYLSRSVDFDDFLESVLDIDLNGPALLITCVILLKFLLAFLLRSTTDYQMKARSFLKDNGKNV